eukprot:2730711-Alexandrium_andersonii.AAC.1
MQACTRIRNARTRAHTESTAVRMRPFYAGLRLSQMQRFEQAAFGSRPKSTCANALSPNSA